MSRIHYKFKDVLKVVSYNYRVLGVFKYRIHIPYSVWVCLLYQSILSCHIYYDLVHGDIRLGNSITSSYSQAHLVSGTEFVGDIDHNCVHRPIPHDIVPSTC